MVPYFWTCYESCHLTLKELYTLKSPVFVAWHFFNIVFILNDSGFSISTVSRIREHQTNYSILLLWSICSTTSTLCKSVKPNVTEKYLFEFYLGYCVSCQSSLWVIQVVNWSKNRLMLQLFSCHNNRNGKETWMKEV